MDKRLLYVELTLCAIVVVWVGVAMYYRNDQIKPDCYDDDESKKD